MRGARRIDDRGERRAVAVLKIDVESFYASLTWRTAIEAAARAGLDLPLIGLLDVFQRAWPPSLPVGVSVSPLLGALVLDEVDRDAQLDAAIHLCPLRWADDAVVVTQGEGGREGLAAAQAAYQRALATRGLTLNAKKSGVVPESMVVEFLGVEVASDGRVRPGRRSLVKALRRIRHRRVQGCEVSVEDSARYWAQLCNHRLDRLDSFRRAVRPAPQDHGNAGIRPPATRTHVFAGNTAAETGGCAHDVGRGPSANRLQEKTDVTNG